MDLFNIDFRLFEMKGKKQQQQQKNVHMLAFTAIKPILNGLSQWYNETAHIEYTS